MYCNVCAKETTQTVQGRYAYGGDSKGSIGPDGDDLVQERTILSCTECMTPQLRWAGGEGPSKFEIFYPPHDVRAIPPWIDSLPSNISSLLRETYQALACNSYWLVGMGIRTLIDMYALERVGDVGDTKAKIERLKAEGYLAGRDVIAVGAAIDVGNDATFKNSRPSLDDCMRAINILEHLLQRIVLDGDAFEIQQQNAKRD